MKWLKRIWYKLRRLKSDAKKRAVSKEDIVSLKRKICSACDKRLNEGASKESLIYILKKVDKLELSLSEGDEEKSIILFDDLNWWASENASTSFKIVEGISSYGLLLGLIILLKSFIGISHVPSGSMRFAIHENDKIFISSSDFSIKYWPFSNPFIFCEDNINRGDAVTCRKRGNQAASAFFKYVKIGDMQLLKRCVAKPGDAVYFYGGLIYVVDKNGVLDQDFLRLQINNRLWHSPIISKNPLYLKRKIIERGFSGAIESYSLFGESVFDVHHNRGANINVYFANGDKVLDNTVNEYGSKYFFEGRIISSNEAMEMYKYKSQSDIDLVMEIKVGSSISRGISYRSPEVSYERIFIDINKDMLPGIMQCIDTERIEISNGCAEHLRSADIGNRQGISSNKVDFADVQDGTYDVIEGNVYKILTLNPTLGIVPVANISGSKISRDTSLSDLTTTNVRRLFNKGIGIFNEGDETFRILAFRNGDLYIGRNKWLDKNNVTVKELLKVNPSLDGIADILDDEDKISIEKIRKKGYHVPENSYMLLGDNFPASSDSRMDGCFSYNDLGGKALFIMSTTNLGRAFMQSMPATKNAKTWMMRSFAILHIVVLVVLLMYVIPWVWGTMHKYEELCKRINGKNQEK